jgi:multiple sugar transport system ATP-binding protein
MAPVTLHGVRKVYEGARPHVAVHGVDLDVADGEFVVLVGPSGCGKSTTLRMVAGLESISAGELRIGDRVVNNLPPKDRDVAMVFQSYALYPHMSVAENMGFALKLRGLPATEIDRRVRQAADVLGLGAVLERKPRHLSGGPRQRVAVGRAIVRQPQVFLFDEPLSNLDAKLRVQTRREIAKLHRELGATMLYVTHDQVEAMTLGDRIVVMNAGHVQQIDTPLNLYEHPVNKFVAGFIGSPAMNFLDGELVADGASAPSAGAPGADRPSGTVHFRAAGGALDFPVPPEHARTLATYAGRRVTLGVRPEDVRVADGADRAAPSATLRLEFTEPMGNEIFVYASVPARPTAPAAPAGSAPADTAPAVTARIAPRRLPEPGERIVVTFDPAKLHFFDPETERRL